jgi:hypothetical protein
MAASLRPAVSGATRTQLRRVTVLHGTGLIFGAIVMGLIVGLLGSLIGALGLKWIPVMLIGIALALSALQSIGFGVPQSRWQVPEYWRRVLDAGTLPIAYGAILGLGIFTAVTVGAFWVFLAISLRYPAPIALIGWSFYALGRLTGFRLALQARPLERIFLTQMQQRLLIISTTAFAALIAIVQ